MQSRLLTQEHDELHHVANLMAHDTTAIPDLAIPTQRKLSRGLAQANENLQMDEWAQETFFVGAIIDDKTVKLLEYRDLTKSNKYRKLWAISLANEIGQLAQGIRDIKGTDGYFLLHLKIGHSKR